MISQLDTYFDAKTVVIHMAKISTGLRRLIKADHTLNSAVSPGILNLQELFPSALCRSENASDSPRLG
jgi:hypothetical protein